MNILELASLRRAVRVALSLLPKGQGATVAFINSAIRDTTPIRVKDDEVEQALIWNQSSGWCDFAWNREMQWDEWHLTERGRDKVKKEGTR